MFDQARKQISEALTQISKAGTSKSERLISSPQGALVKVVDPAPEREVLNFCSNNYLGLANSPELIAAAKEGLDQFGFGLSSVRFICGTQTLHKKLEAAISKFLGTEDCILYSSCFDANGGLFEPLLDKDCAIISDQLNHASIIDGVRLCKAQRFRYAHIDMNDLEAKLKEASGCKRIMVATDGVFSMDGDIAPLEAICDLAEKYRAMVMVDDSHATGLVGETGRGTIEHCGVGGRVDIINSTFGKALGGASGGFTAARGEIVELLRQRSRPYLFSNTLAPAIAAATLKCLELLSASAQLITKLNENTAFFRSGMDALGFDVRVGTHPIVAVMLGDAALATRMADALLQEGIYVVGFSYPVVPDGAARIRVQLSAAHSRNDLQRALDAFSMVGKKLGVIQPV
jgi:glycine C-acetyltransferase